GDAGRALTVWDERRGRGCCLICVFFFQAEDGIRDYKVTGVQTCALPILPRVPLTVVPLVATAFALLMVLFDSSSFWLRLTVVARSEERRVGKEWRAWWVTAPTAKKNVE